MYKLSIYIHIATQGSAQRLPGETHAFRRLEFVARISERPLSIEWEGGLNGSPMTRGQGPPSNALYLRLQPRPIPLAQAQGRHFCFKSARVIVDALFLLVW